MKQPIYKGIALFGAPGSGKTTIAQMLSAAFPSSQYIEAFHAVIQPAGVIRDALPKTKEFFLNR